MKKAPSVLSEFQCIRRSEISIPRAPIQTSARVPCNKHPINVGRINDEINKAPEEWSK